MGEMKKIWQKYSPYFVDFWQYFAIIILFTIGALIFL